MAVSSDCLARMRGDVAPAEPSIRLAWEPCAKS